MSVSLIELVFDSRPGDLTREQVANRYGVSTRTIRIWILAGRLPEAHGVLAATRELLWDVNKLPDPATFERPKRPGRPAGSTCRRPVAPYQEPTADPARAFHYA